jgi:acyl carrier protein
MDMELGGDVMVSPMTREQIFYKVCEIIKNETPVEADMEIKMDTLLTNDMELDSLDLIDITMEVEREFGMKIPDDDFYKLKTCSVGEFCDVIENVLRK